MRPYKLHLNVKKSSRTNKDYIDILKKIVAEIDKQEQLKNEKSEEFYEL